VSEKLPITGGAVFIGSFLADKLAIDFNEGMRELIKWSRRAKAMDKFEEAARELTKRGPA